jgi:hypothetical protein
MGRHGRIFVHTHLKVRDLRPPDLEVLGVGHQLRLGVEGPVAVASGLILGQHLAVEGGVAGETGFGGVVLARADAAISDDTSALSTRRRPMTAIQTAARHICQSMAQVRGQRDPR